MTARRTVEPLTPRQKEVLDLLAEGRTNPEIAQRLGISLDGAKWHVREVLARLEVTSREEAGAYWRREHSSWRRLAWALPALSGVGLKVVLSVVAVVGAGVVAGALLLRDDGDSAVGLDATSTPAPTMTATATTVVDEFAPHSGIPIVDAVIGIVKSGDAAAFRALMKEFPEPCTTKLRQVGSPPACPVGVADGSPVNAFRASAGERVDAGADLDQFLGIVVPGLSTLHGVAVAQSDTKNGFFPPWKYEVIVYGAIGQGQTWGEYLLDDTGIVGVWAPGGGFVVSDRAKAVPDADWLVAPIGVALFAGVPGLFVLGRDKEVRFPVRLPAACNGKPFGIRLYGYSPPGVSGGIQDITEPGLDVVVRAVAGSGTTSVSFPLPSTASTPMRVRPGLRSSCLSGIAVQGGFDLALLAPASDAEIAVIEFSGKVLELRRTDGTTLGQFLKSLTATVSGVECETISTSDPTVRNARGNIEFRLGTADQPAGCRAPGQPVSFIMEAPNTDSLAGEPLAEKPAFVPGAIQLLENFGPEPISN